MKNKAHAWIAGLLATILGIMWFGSDRVARVLHEISNRLLVPGLNPQADIRYRRLDVGKVDTLIFNPQMLGQILIRLKINFDTPLTDAIYRTLSYQGVTGMPIYNWTMTAVIPVNRRAAWKNQHGLLCTLVFSITFRAKARRFYCRPKKPLPS